MIVGDYGEECENCQCLICLRNDDAICPNCGKCNGSISYSKWMMDCKKYDECKNPEETIKTVLGSILT